MSFSDSADLKPDELLRAQNGRSEHAMAVAFDLCREKLRLMLAVRFDPRLRARVDTEDATLEPLDREVLVLRHFEELSNAETAKILGVTEAASAQRHLRALKRLKDAARRITGLESGFL